MVAERTDFIDLLELDQNGRKNYVRSLSIDVGHNVDEHYYSPDGAALNRYLYHDIFVFGRMKQGFGLHEKLRVPEQEHKTLCLGFGVTASTALRLWRQDSPRGAAVLLPEPDKKLQGRICGEVWRVPVSIIYNLDFYESNNTYTKRMKMPIRLERGGKYIYHPAWAYVGMPTYWKDTSKKKAIPLVPCETSLLTEDKHIKHYLYKYNYEKGESLH